MGLYFSIFKPAISLIKHFSEILNFVHQKLFIRRIEAIVHLQDDIATVVIRRVVKNFHTIVGYKII